MMKFLPTIALAGKVMVILVVDKIFGITDMLVGAFGKFGK